MNRRITRGNFIKGSAVAGAGLILLPGSTAIAATRDRRGGVTVEGGDPDSKFFSTAFVEYANSYDTNSGGSLKPYTDSGGDLWPSCWADDDNLYTSNGDGRGFGRTSYDIVMNRVYGTPDTGITGKDLAAGAEIANIWGDPGEYNRKPTGMVAIDSDGDGKDELYVAVQDLRKPGGSEPAFDDAPNASISKSEDYGETWQKTEKPMFTDYNFTTIMFLDYGKSYENVRVLGPEGADYVYAYGMDYNWRQSFSNVVPDPTRIYLARIPKNSIQDRSTWEFYTGTRPNGRPTWSSDYAKRAPILHDERRIYPTLGNCNTPGLKRENLSVISQGSVVYNKPLDRYIYTSWTRYTFEFYEAPEPWGPWKLFARKDFGASPWYGRPSGSDCPGPKEGGYSTTIPSKFISRDGKTMWVQSNSSQGLGYVCGYPNYNFSFRKLEVEPFHHTVPSNKPDPTNNLAMTGENTTPIEKTASHGYDNYFNDGKKNQNESSFDCDESKPLDFWGYTWSRRYNMDRVVYTTGDMFSDGGWFEDLRVQVRQDFEWRDVNGLSITPDYPYNGNAGPNKTYTLTFYDTRADGVRIIGKPGGSAHFTTIAELEVYYDDRSRQGPPPGRPRRG